MKRKIKAVIDFVEDVILIYSVLMMIFIAISFLFESAIISVPILIIALAIKVVPMIKEKSERR